VLLQHTAKHCNALHDTARYVVKTLQHREALQHRALKHVDDLPSLQHCKAMETESSCRYILMCSCNTLQHTATYCNTERRSTLTACPHYNTVQNPATHCNTLQHTAALYNTLQHTTTHCNNQLMCQRSNQCNRVSTFKSMQQDSNCCHFTVSDLDDLCTRIHTTCLAPGNQFVSCVLRVL